MALADEMETRERHQVGREFPVVAVVLVSREPKGCSRVTHALGYKEVDVFKIWVFYFETALANVKKSSVFDGESCMGRFDEGVESQNRVVWLHYDV